jgi:hypothetical protein
LLVLALTTPLAATAQPSGPAAAFTPEQLEQVAAPIALYPDPLLAQLLMASTYPLERQKRGGYREPDYPYKYIREKY